MSNALGQACLLLLLPVCLMFAPMRPHSAEPTAEASPAGDGAPSLGGDALPSAEEFARLCECDPAAALTAAMKRDDAEVEGYTCVLLKQERIKGKVLAEERIECAFRKTPYAVYMKWLEGKDSRVDRTLYVPGENADKALVKSRLGLVLRFEPTHPLAKEASRVSITEFGIGGGMKRSLDAWVRAKKAGKLVKGVDYNYLGVQSRPEWAGRACHVIRRKADPPEEDDGMTEITIALDVETWLQIGSDLKTHGGAPLAKYHFRDVVLNPTFDPEQFRPDVLK